MVQYMNILLLPLFLDAEEKENPVVKENTDPKPVNALPGEDSNFKAFLYAYYMKMQI